MNKDLIRSVKFTLFSVSAGVIQIGSFTLLNELLHLDYWVSYLIALILSVLGILRSTAGILSNPRTMCRLQC